MSGQGLAHAALSLVPLQFGLPNALIYVAVVTNIVVLTNLVTSIPAAYIRQRAQAQRKAVAAATPTGPIVPPAGP